MNTTPATPAELVELEDWAYDYIDALTPGAHGFIFHEPTTHAAPPWWEFPHGVPLRVLLSARTEADGRRWVHVSCSHRNGRLPSWDALKKVKAAFIGADKRAIQILAPDSEWYSHWEVLHLWYCLDGDGLPDFRVQAKNGERGI
jgi:hypothetical protein